MPDMVMGFQIRPETTLRCDRCHKPFGKHTPQKIGYEIREGKGTGKFCSGNCVNLARKEMEEAEELDINTFIDSELE